MLFGQYAYTDNWHYACADNTDNLHYACADNNSNTDYWHYACADNSNTDNWQYACADNWYLLLHFKLSGVKKVFIFTISQWMPTKSTTKKYYLLCLQWNKIPKQLEIVVKPVS